MLVWALYTESYPRLGTEFFLSTYRAYIPVDKFGGRELIFWAVLRP
jgi:hypothetical protein